MNTDRPEGCTSEICFCFLIPNEPYYCDGRHYCTGSDCCMEDDPGDDNGYAYDLAKDERLGIL